MIHLVEVVFLDIPRFLVMVCAAHIAGELVTKVKLPAITGYMLSGIIVGPYLLHQVSEDQVRNLSFINYFALSTIAFSAGSELYFPEIKNLFRIISLHVTAIVTSTLALVTTSVILIGGYLGFLDQVSFGCKVNIALLCSAIMIARSPSSALAIFCEVRANGPITMASLGITVVSDVVLLLMFSLTASFAKAECNSEGFKLESLLALAIGLALCVVAGYLLAHLIMFFLWIPNLSSPQRGLFILPSGFFAFFLSKWFNDSSQHMFGFEVTVEPLLLCMIASCIAGNESTNRRKFANILHKTSPYVFLPFFTLTGASLDIMALKDGILLTLLLVTTRFVAVVGSTYVAGKYIAQESKEHYQNIGLTLLAQAGTTLGLANEVSTYGDWGEKVSAALFGAVIINQLLGLQLCKWSIKRTGETGRDIISREIVHGSKHDQIVIFGINSTSVCVAAKLSHVPRNVMMVQSDAIDEALVMNLMERVQTTSRIISDSTKEASGDFSRISLCSRQFHVRLWKMVYSETLGDNLTDKVFSFNEHIQSLMEEIEELIPESSNALVLALPSDSMNLLVCRLIRKYRKIGLPMTVIIQSANSAEHFHKEGVYVVYPPSVVSESVVRSVSTNDSFLEGIIHPLESSTKCSVRIDQNVNDNPLVASAFSPYSQVENLESSSPEYRYDGISSLGCLGLADEPSQFRPPKLRRGPSLMAGSLGRVLEAADEKEYEILRRPLLPESP